MSSKNNHLLVITSSKPLELAMLLETAINLKKKNEEVTYIDLTTLPLKILEFPIGDRLNSINFKIKMKKIDKKLNELGIKKITHKLEPLNLTKESRLQKFAKEAALNEIISLKRESNPCLNCYSKLNSDLIRVYLDTYLHLKKVIRQQLISNVYIYNGRFISGNAVWNLCKYLKIDLKFLEQANMSFPDRYWLFNKPVHSPEYRAEIVNKFFKSITKIQKRNFNKISRDWYLARIGGVSQKFTSKQTENFRNLDNNSKIISYFHSSEDELILSNLKEKSWGTQFKIINKLCELVKSNPDFKLVIRIHPNLKYKSIKEIKKWNMYLKNLKRKYTNIDYLWFDSPINTYSLIKESSLIFTSGSTIGPESAFMGKSNVLCGNSLYSKMEMSYKPKNPRELRRNFSLYMNHPKKMEFIQNAKKFGYFQMAGGLHYENVFVNSDATQIRYDQITLNYSKVYSGIIRLDKLILNFIDSKKRCSEC